MSMSEMMNQMDNNKSTIKNDSTEGSNNNE